MSDYWVERSAQLESLTQKRTDETVKFVNEIYSDAIKSINDRVKATFDKYTKSRSLTEEEALRRLNTKQTAEMREELKKQYDETDLAELKKRIADMLDDPAYADRISRLEALANEIYMEALLLGTTEQVQAEKRLIAEYKHTYYRTTFDIQQYTGEYYDFEKLSSGRVREALRRKWLGKNYSDRVWDNTDKTAEKLKRVIINGVMTGQSVRTMTDALTAALGETPDSGARFKFSRLIRTEVNYISGQAAQKAYEQAEIDEYTFLATLDKQTCRDCSDGKRKSCAELDGKHFKISEAEVGVNKHPMHPFCRCSDCPYIPNRKAVRAARDENGKTIFVPSDMTYGEWYRKYVEKDHPLSLAAKIGGNGIPEHDSPIFMGKIDYNNKDEVMKVLQNFEEYAIYESIETALVITREGDIYKCFGTRTQVFPNIDLGDKFIGATVSHNHLPDETEYTFSREDLNTFRRYKLDIMHGCDMKYKYELTNNAKEIDEAPEVWQTEENFQHGNMIETAKNVGVGYRRWKNDKRRSL